MTGLFKDHWKCPLPFIPGYDVSGIVEEVGEDVTKFAVGDAVFCTNWGKVRHDDDEGNTIASAFAEYIDLPAYKLSHKPKEVSHVIAAAAVMVSVTALQVLDALKVSGGQKILVIGGSGAVGMQFIQLAKLRNNYVVTTASARAFDFVSQFGANRVINYNEHAWWEETTPNYDIVIDAVGEIDAFLHAQVEGVVKFGGSFLTIADFMVGFNPVAHAPRFAFAAFFGSHQDSNDQDTIIRLVAEGKLRVSLDTVFPFTQEGARGIFNKVKEGKSLGKNVLQIVV